jgi:hypothetical protein
MIFDLMAKLFSKHDLPQEFRIPMKHCKLFVFPGRARELLLKERNEEEAAFLRENFFLPFQYVAIEDTASCVILWDKDKGAKGLHVERMFLECMPADADAEEFREKARAAGSEDAVEILKSLPPKTCIISYGCIRYCDMGTQSMRLEGKLLAAIGVCPDGVVFPPEELSKVLPPEPSTRNVGMALEEIMYFNSPDRFIFEKTPKAFLDGKTKSVPRSHERPIYTILSPTEIRKEMQLPESTDKRSVRLHERRRHYRTLNDDRFVNAKGKTIVVKASWIGPSENIVGNKRYKVLLDR